MYRVVGCFISLVLLLAVVLTAPRNNAYAAEFGEAPMLAEMVANGKLPPAAERLPKTPMIVTPTDKLGQ